MYDELVKRLMEHYEYGKTLKCGTGEIFKEAADAIEELSVVVESYRNRMAYVPEPPKEDT